MTALRKEEFRPTNMIVDEFFEWSTTTESDTWTNIWAYTAIPSVRETLVLESTQVTGWLLLRDTQNNWPSEPEHLSGGAQIVLPSICFAANLVDAYATTHFVAEAPQA
jgi:hypothetical protein